MGQWQQHPQSDGPLDADPRKLHSGLNYKTEARGSNSLDSVSGDYTLDTYVGDYTDPEDGYVCSDYNGNFSDSATTNKRSCQTINNYGADVYVYGLSDDYPNFPGDDEWSVNAGI